MKIPYRKSSSPLSRRWWSIALSALLLAGGSALALGLPPLIHIPKVKDREAGDPDQSAVFSHWQHDAYACASCHPSIFPQYKLGFTHKDMEAGRFCGSCHDGKTAFSPQDKGVDCDLCHVPTDEPTIDEGDLWN